MCIIVHKPHNVAPVAKKVLRQCWQRNSDGAGYAYLAENKNGERYWTAKKGFMSWKKFWKAFSAEELKKEHTYVCHFRIKSAGDITAGNTHPFPITNDYNQMVQMSFNDENIVFHNGTCGVGDSGYSDTMVFIKDKIDALWEPAKRDPRVWKILKDLLNDTRDRWLIGTPDGVEKIGTWHEDAGVFFSNLMYKSTYTTPRSSGIYSTNRSRRYASPTKEEIIDEYVGLVDEDGSVTWEVMDNGVDVSKIVMCPYCFEDEKLDESPFVGVGDTVCLICGAVFNDMDAKVWTIDEDIREKYLKQKTSQGTEKNTCQKS